MVSLFDIRIGLFMPVPLVFNEFDSNRLFELPICPFSTINITHTAFANNTLNFLRSHLLPNQIFGIGGVIEEKLFHIAEQLCIIVSVCIQKITLSGFQNRKKYFTNLSNEFLIMPEVFFEPS